MTPGEQDEEEQQASHVGNAEENHRDAPACAAYDGALCLPRAAHWSCILSSLHPIPARHALFQRMPCRIWTLARHSTRRVHRCSPLAPRVGTRPRSYPLAASRAHEHALAPALGCWTATVAAIEQAGRPARARDRQSHLPRPVALWRLRVHTRAWCDDVAWLVIQPICQARCMTPHDGRDRRVSIAHAPWQA